MIATSGAAEDAGPEEEEAEEQQVAASEVDEVVIDPQVRVTIIKVARHLLHRKKKVREFPVPSRDVTTKLSLGGNNDVITELFLPRGSLVSGIPAGDGKLVNLFYGVCTKRIKYTEHKPFGRHSSSIYSRRAGINLLTE